MPRSLNVLVLFQNAKRALLRGALSVRRAITSHPRIALVGVAVGFGVLATLAPAYAQSPGVCSNATDLSCQVLNYIMVALGSLAYALGGLAMGINLLFAWLLISFAKYNTFTAAQPVVIGWPLVRDVVNMFFIVVLLVVAFSTIIGYRPNEFGYKAVLPKLLLMAVLINFSKTLVGVMIDFSQVITLTFVNGFAQAAFGNFAKAFQLSNILALQGKSNPLSSTAGVQDNFSVLMSLVFGLVIMFFTGTVLLIMCIYFLVRIVLLWMLLIFSPIAFFALALPGKLQKGISALSDKWWKDLGSLLTGGPIVAFFLWLTLAVVQSSAQPFTGIYSPASPTEAASLSPTITKASDPSNVATMMVAIIMLLTGLNTAVEVSKQAAPQLGAFAQQIKSSGGPVGVAARYSYRGAAAATGATGRAVDRRFQVTENSGSALLRAGQAVSRVPVIGGIAAAGLTRAGGNLRGIGAAERAQAAKEFQARTANLSPKQKLQALDAEIARANSAVPGVGNRRTLDALTIQKGLMMTGGPAIKARSGELEAEYLKKNKRGANESEAERAAKAKAYGAARSKQEAALALSNAHKSAEGIGDTATVDKINDARSKDPSLHSTLPDLYKVAANKIDDYKQAFKDVKTEAWQDSGTFLAYMKASGLVDEKSGKMRDGYQNDEKWKELTSAAGGNRSKYVQQQARMLETTPGQDSAKLQLAAMGDGVGADIIKAGDNARQTVSFGSYASTDAAGKVTNIPYSAVADMNAGGGVSLVHGERQIQDFGDLTRGLSTEIREGLENALSAKGIKDQRLTDFSKGFRSSMSPEQAEHVTRNAAVYSSPPAARAAGALPGSVTQERERGRQIQVLAQGQAMGVPPPPQAQKDVVEYAMTQASSSNPVDKLGAAKIMANVSAEDIQDKPDIRQAIAEALDGKLPQLADAYSAAKNDPASMKKIEDMIKAVHSTAQQAVTAAQRSGTALSATDAKLQALSEDIKKTDRLKQITERKKKV